MLRRPVSKNCRFCGRFMFFYWTEQHDGLEPMFYCEYCNEWDFEIIEVKYYEWIIYRDTINFKEAKKELLSSDYFALLSEQRWMKYLFLNRPYIAVPQLM